MKYIVLSLALSTLSLFAAEYPIGVAVSPRGTDVVLSNGRIIVNGSITIEPHMIRKAIFRLFLQQRTAYWLIQRHL